MKTGGNLLVPGGVGQEVAGHLLDGELVKRHVPVEGVDDPIAVRPNRARQIFFIAIGICVTRYIQPLAGPAFAIVRRSQQSIHNLVVGIRAAVREIVVDLLQRGRKADKIKAQTPDKSGAIRFRRRPHMFVFQTRQHESINRITDPLFILHRWQHGLDRWLKCPMITIGCGRFGAGCVKGWSKEKHGHNYSASCRFREQA